MGWTLTMTRRTARKAQLTVRRNLFSDGHVTIDVTMAWTPSAPSR